jgi:hypothetical protein
MRPDLPLRSVWPAAAPGGQESPNTSGSCHSELATDSNSGCSDGSRGACCPAAHHKRGPCRRVRGPVLPHRPGQPRRLQPLPIHARRGPLRGRRGRLKRYQRRDLARYGLWRAIALWRPGRWRSTPGDPRPGFVVGPRPAGPNPQRRAGVPWWVYARQARRGRRGPVRPRGIGRPIDVDV